MAFSCVRMISLRRFNCNTVNRILSRSMSVVGKETADISDRIKIEIPAEATSLKDMPISDMKNPFEKERAQCVLCKHKVVVDYKNVKLLSQFVSPYTGRIYGRHITGLCSQQQKLVEQEIAKSRNAGFMAYYLKEVEFLKDPKLFDPERPIRPHRF